VPDAASMQDRASSGVRKFDEAGGASAQSAVAEDVVAPRLWGWTGAKASMVDATANRKARLEADDLMMFCDFLFCAITSICYSR